MQNGNAGLAREVASLGDAIANARVCVLTGAGISTDSGIPDYRGPEGSQTRRNPIRYNEFISSQEARRRYWARSCRGWPYMRSRRPNESHLIVATLQRDGVLGPLITQNVDGLHTVAGSDPVLELHGALDTTVCLECGERRPRSDVQTEMERDNPGWVDQTAAIAPDGDVELDAELIRRFVAPRCRRCNGPLKPDVVLFGESVPRDRVQRCFAWIDACDALLVLGSSLAVYSGYRFAEAAYRLGKAVYLVNVGRNRADAIATRKIDAPLRETLTLLRKHLGDRSDTADTPIQV
jgi:NAD-dependent SIR2 family protein deacetylase